MKRLFPAHISVLCSLLLSFVFYFFDVQAKGQDLNELPRFFFDAKSTYFTRDGTQQVFEGEVIALGSKAIVTADKVVVDQGKGFIRAFGHVIVIVDTQIFTAQSVEYVLKSGDFKLNDATVVLNDDAFVGKVRDQILGMTPEEIEFEAKRASQLERIRQNKSKMSRRARALIKQGREIPDDIIKTYALELEREQMISEQKSPGLSRMSEERRENVIRRRKYWNDARGDSIVKEKFSSALYFKMTGDSIERTNQNDFLARNSLWTSCVCDEGETPAWAFRSSHVFAQQGGFATFYNPILEIKGIPVLYLPYLRLPIKDQRQSGFLLPVLTHEPESGTIYSQPLFLDLGKDLDATVKTDTYEKRGTRLGAEVRYRNRKNSGFQFNVEAMRDRLWLERRSFRDDYRDAYLNGLRQARSDNSGNGPEQIQYLSGREYHIARLRQRSYWLAVNPECVTGTAAQQLACEEKIEQFLTVPNNVTRGSAKWSGNYFMSDRISMVSSGQFVTDRFYNVDLFVYDSEAQLFASKRAEPAFNLIDNRIHFDYSNFYLGLGSQFGDSATNNDRYEGQHLPYNLRAVSLMHRLTPDAFTFMPIYAQVAVQSYRILEVTGESEDFGSRNSSHESIGSGNWSRVEGHVVAPILHRTAISVDHFTDMEARHIKVDRLTGKNSSISSIKTGFRFNLPIDGKTRLSVSTDEAGEEEVRYLQHIMNWGATVSLRPSVTRRGQYATEAGSYPDSNYFITDTDQENASDSAIERTDFLRPYQIVSFSTSHRWKFFTRGWSMIAGSDKNQDKKSSNKGDENETPQAKESSEARARRELMHSMDRSVKSFSDIVSRDGSKFFIDRYQLLDSDYQEPLGFDANISYDYLMDQQRKKLGASIEDTNKKESLQPWSPLETSAFITWSGWTLSNAIQHNIYLRRNTAVKFSLGLPTFYDTNLSYSYTVTLEVLKDAKSAQYSYQPTTTREVTLASSLTQPFTTVYKFGKKLVDNPNTENEEQYMQGLGIVYNSSSRCWSLAFSREKGYGVEERDASFRLELNVIFMGNIRQFPTMHEPVLREVRNSEEK